MSAGQSCMSTLNCIEIVTKSFNEVVKNSDLMNSLRSLTLAPYSGLNYELNMLEKISKNREAVAKVIMAYYTDELVGWALLSREYSKFQFPNGTKGFKPENGMLFQVYVAPDYRRCGIATSLFKEASNNAGSYKIGVSPWNTPSRSFFSTLEQRNTFYL